MKIKVCGITSYEQMQTLQELGVDYAGMIFYEGSKRFVGKGMKNEKLKIKNLGIKKVGVFVNADVETIKRTVDEYRLSAVQLHGDENAEFCSDLRNYVEVIKVFRISGNEKVEGLVDSFEDVCDYFLFDTDTKEYGGSGKQFNWRVVEGAEIKKPFFLSGGIGSDDAERINQFRHPNFCAVDVNSQFEVEPGVKDLMKIEQFIKAINHG